MKSWSRSDFNAAKITHIEGLSKRFFRIFVRKGPAWTKVPLGVPELHAKAATGGRFKPPSVPWFGDSARGAKCFLDKRITRGPDHAAIVVRHNFDGHILQDGFHAPFVQK